jgi:WhiB family redox-sensing transcriptional regulator
MQIDAAKLVCLECDVRDECLEWAMATGQDAGVWGGLSEEERRRVRKGWAADAAVSEARVG